MKVLKVGAPLLVCLAYQIGSAQIIEGHKIEAPRFYSQVIIGLGVTQEVNTTLGLPGNSWTSPTHILQAHHGSYEATDFLRITPKVQHVVPLQKGDPPKGPEFNYAHYFQSRVGLNGTQMLIYFDVGPHGSGGDGIFGCSIVEINPTDIRFWSDYQIGVHGLQGDTMFGLICELLPQASTILEGATSVMVHRNGRKVYLVGSKKDRRRIEVMRTQIVQGTPTSPGVVIAEFNGNTDWVDLGKLGCGVASEDLVDPAYLDDLETENCFMRVEFGPLPYELYEVPLRRGDREFLTYHPIHHVVTSGIEFGGTLASLQESDEDRLFILCDESISMGALETITQVVFTPSPQLSARVESSSTRDDIVELVEFYRIDAQRWDLAGLRKLGLSDSVFQASVVAENFTYSTPAAGTTRVRLRWIPAQDLEAVDGWLIAIDQISLIAGRLD